MALPSYGSHDVAPSPLARMLARVKALLAEKTDNRIAQLVAGKVFMVRLASALLALVSQVLLARWMGRFEFGVYIYVWTWVLMIGALSDVGLSSAARRFIPEYSERKVPRPVARLPQRQRWLGFCGGRRDRRARRARRVAAVAASRRLRDRAALSRLRSSSRSTAWCRSRPASRNPTTGRTSRWRRSTSGASSAITALVGAPWLFGAPTDAVTAMAIAAGATWAVTIGQLALLNRRLAGKVPEGPQAIRGEGTGSPPRCRSSWSRASTCCSLTSTSWRSSTCARPTRSRSITPPRGCSPSSPSSISPSPAPPRTSSRSITSPATASASPRSSPKPPAGRSGPRLRSAR